MTTAIAGTTDPRILEARKRAKKRRQRCRPPSTGWRCRRSRMFFLLHTIPVIQGFFYSFTDYAGYGAWNWVGFKNYANLINDDRIRDSYWFTIKFAVVATILINIVVAGDRHVPQLQDQVPHAVPRHVLHAVRDEHPDRRLHLQLHVRQLAAVVRREAGHRLAVDEHPRQREPGVARHRGRADWQSMAFTIIIYLAGLQTIDPQLTRRRRSTGHRAGCSSARSRSRCSQRSSRSTW